MNKTQKNELQITLLEKIGARSKIHIPRNIDLISQDTERNVEKILAYSEIELPEVSNLIVQHIEITKFQQLGFLAYCNTWDFDDWKGLNKEVLYEQDHYRKKCKNLIALRRNILRKNKDFLEYERAICFDFSIVEDFLHATDELKNISGNNLSTLYEDHKKDFFKNAETLKENLLHNEREMEKIYISEITS